MNKKCVVCKEDKKESWIRSFLMGLAIVLTWPFFILLVLVEADSKKVELVCQECRAEVMVVSSFIGCSWGFLLFGVL